MSEFFVAPIVEGHGEVDALPILLQRLLFDVRDDSFVRINPALRIKVGSFLRDDDYFAKYVELAARKAKAHDGGSILILLDSEDDCPAELGPDLARRAAAVRNDVPTVVALAHREYETWFLAAARSLRGIAGLATDLDPPADPEAIRDAKGWLSAQMPSPYNEPNDQPAFTRQFSFDEAACVPSFARLRGKLQHLFGG
ncbi:MAG: hypothetical protein QOD80_1583 [Verrucomicrobiota bacterium]|jgi:hypothetical protein